MYPNIHANRCFKYIMFLLICYLLIACSIHLKLDMFTDDAFYLHLFEHKNLQQALSTLEGFLKIRYTTWGGRVTIDAIMVLTTPITVFWKVAIPGCLLITAISISRIATQQVKLHYVLFSLLLLFSIPSAINNNAVFWVTGFYNYLLPFSLSCYALSIFFLLKEKKDIEYFLALICTFIFSYAEQYAVFFLVVSTISFIFIKDTRLTGNFFIFIFSFINSFVLFTAPGNHNRLSFEMWSWFPDYQFYSILQKITFGIDKLHQLVIMDWNVPLIILFLTVMVKYILYGKKTVIGIISLCIIVTFTNLLFVKYLGFDLKFLGDGFFSDLPLNFNKWVLITTYVSYFVILLTLLSVLILMALTINNIKITVIFSSIWIIGIFNIIILGLSPTVYASNFRVDYIFEGLIVLNTMLLMNNKNYNKPCSFFLENVVSIKG